MESFIRSKYESRRWALDGPPPEDPSILEDEPPISTPPRTLQDPLGSMHHSSETSVKKPPTTSTHATQPQRNLLSMSISNQDQPNSYILQQGSTPSRVATQTHQPRVSATNNDLFDLDFRAPSTIPATSSPTATRDVKTDILSLFSTTPKFPVSNTTQTPVRETSGNFQVQQAASSMSMTGSTGIGHWGVHSGWTPQATLLNQSNLWASQPAPQPQATAHNPNPSNVWASTDRVTSVLPNEPSKKQDDVFGDLWGGYS
jgi:stromal membrane-associated protein